jgi:hypothetical protein
MMTIKDNSENDWGFFVEMDYPSFDKIKRENHFKKIYWKMNYQLNTIQEEEDQMDHIILISEKQTKKTIQKINVYMLFHYTTATLVVLSFVYFVFCIL